MMKRVLVVLFVLMLTDGLFAQDGEKTPEDTFKFKYNGMLYIYHTRLRSIDGGDPMAFWYTRVRQYLSVGNKRLGTMVKFEIDPTWGSGPKSNNVRVGADLKAELQIKNAYLWFKMPDMPLKVKAGIHFHKSPGSFMFADDVGAVSLNYSSGSVDINAIYCKMGEFANADSMDDASMAGVSATLKMGSLSLTPALYYYYVGPGVSAGDVSGIYSNTYYGIQTRNAFIPQLGLTMKYGGARLSAVVAYGFGKIKDNGDRDASGLGVDLKLKYSLNSGIKVGLMANYLSGDDAVGTGDDSNFAQFMPGLIKGRGVRLTGTSLFLQGGLTAQIEEALGAKSIYKHGLLMIGLNSTLQFGKLTVKAAAAWLNAAEEYSSGNRGYGIELDVIVEYTLYKNLKLQLEASYFKPIDAYQSSTSGLPDVCSFYALGTRFKW